VNYKIDSWVCNNDGLTFENSKLICNCVLVSICCVFEFLRVLIFGMLGYSSLWKMETANLTKGSTRYNWL